MRKLAATFVVLFAVLCAGAGTASAVPGIPPFPHLRGVWSHAEINIKIRRTPHTLILDHGKITQASFTQITLREPDGSVVAVPLDVRTLVTIYGRVATIGDLRRKMVAETMRIDGGAAVRVRVVLVQ
jgi:hypothetical protein